jgi:predicted nucleic acid-binding protein
LFEYIETEDILICISSSIIEEFFYVLLSILKEEGTKDAYSQVHASLNRIYTIEPLLFLEPKNYRNMAYDTLKLIQLYDIEPHDAYILEVCLQNKVEYIATYDKNLAKAVKKIGTIKVMKTD